MSCSYCEIDDSLGEDRKHARKTHANGTDIEIRFWSELYRIRTRAEHLRRGLDTHMRLESHDYFIGIMHGSI